MILHFNPTESRLQVPTTHVIKSTETLASNFECLGILIQVLLLQLQVHVLYFSGYPIPYCSTYRLIPFFKRAIFRTVFIASEPERQTFLDMMENYGRCS